MQATPLSPKATEIINRIFSKADEDGCVKIDNTNGAFMPVTGESYLITGAYKGYLAHYFTQNGDLMDDPAVTFIEVCSTKEIFAMDFSQSATGTFQEPCIYHSGQVIVKPGHLKAHLDLNNFVEQWLNNIVQQQGI